MADHVDYDVMRRMWASAAERVRNAKQTLSTLDAATGDGDHGTAMGKVADAITRTMDNHGDKKLASLLADIGWAAMGTDAGSTGPLYGSWFLGMSEQAGDTALDAAEFAGMLEAGVANLQLNTKAKPGDKTMMDALVPATDAIRTAANEGRSIADALNAGAHAAAAGAEATKQMVAAFGRARHIGERSIGHVDPGAASMSLIFAGFTEGFTNA